jgi:hypothetical protein
MVSDTWTGLGPNVPDTSPDRSPRVWGEDNHIDQVT